MANSDRNGNEARFVVRRVYFSGKDSAESFPIDDPDPYPGRKPAAFGVYENLPDGRQEHLTDFRNQKAAEDRAAQLNSNP